MKWKKKMSVDEEGVDKNSKRKMPRPSPRFQKWKEIPFYNNLTLFSKLL